MGVKYGAGTKSREIFAVYGKLPGLKMKEINRRTFLKWGAAFGSGIVVGELCAPVGTKINKSVQQATGHQSGNAGDFEKIEKACGSLDNACAEDYQLSVAHKTYAVLVAPPMEELLFRAVPSGGVSEWMERESPGKDVLFGTGKIGITRRELLVGVASSVVFGGAHNLTKEGIDIKTIPALQTVFGMVAWFLQRKFGFAANTVAHMWGNFRIYCS